MSKSEARVAYEQIYREWLDAEKLAALYKTTAQRLLMEMRAIEALIRPEPLEWR